MFVYVIKSNIISQEIEVYVQFSTTTNKRLQFEMIVKI